MEIKSDHKPSETEEAKSQRLVKEFDWEDDTEEGAINASESLFAQNVVSCVWAIHDSLPGWLQPEQFTDDPSHITVHIPIEFHPLLEYCIKDDWSDETRSNILDLVFLAFDGTIDCDFKKILAEEVNKRVLPITEDHRRIRTVKRVFLTDDPLEKDNSKRFFVDLEFGEEANPLWGKES